ncbi:ribonuclease H-like domain-containing protein [Tanacetum coccineum]
MTKAHFEGEQSTITKAKPNDLNTGVQVQDLEETIRHKPNKVKVVKTSMIATSEEHEHQENQDDLNEISKEKDDAKPPIFADTFGSSGGNDSETSGLETHAKEVVDNGNGSALTFWLDTKVHELSNYEKKLVSGICCLEWGSKSPGPDGFNFNFIKAYWEVLRFDFYDCVKHFKATGKLANGCNPSFIVLIPKKCDLLGFSDYRPISLIGCVYKVVSKILTLRLAKVISFIIGPNQMAFLAGRQILDGCLIANEIIRMEKIENHNLLLFKVDFEKAFDCVNWRFLHDIMRQIEFKMERGLRQGDSLSPFLFLLVAEALQVSITEACNKCFYKGVYRSEDGLNVSLLQYADDALFFGKWSRSNARNLILILKCFEEASAPLKIIKLLESLRCRFFWGFNEDHHGISWVKWDSILVSPRTWSLRMVLILVKMFGFQMYPALMDLSRALGARFFPGIANRHKMKGSSLDDISSLTSHIGNFTLSDGDDKWVWKDDASGNFKVSNLSVCIQNNLFAECYLGLHHIWNSWILRKVNLCVWRTFINRFPTRLNLIMRGVILNSTSCPFCDTSEESIDHYLISCYVVVPIWRKVWAWWGLVLPVSFSSFSISDISLAIIGFLNNPVLSKILHGGFQCVIWAIWKWRNKVVNASFASLIDAKNEDIFPSIQRLSKLWIAARACTLDTFEFSRFVKPVGDGHSIPVTNTGHSILPTPTRSLHFNNVLITPHIVKNLISVRQFVRDNNCTIEFDAFGFSVKDFLTRRVLLRCDITEDLYLVTTPSPISHAFLVSQHMWHQRLGHPGGEVLRRLVSSNFISYNKEKPPVPCHACQLGKHARLQLVSSNTVISSCFDIIHSDVWTSPISSLSGFKYYVLFLDHYSQFVWVYPLVNKYDVMSKFMLFRNYVRTQFKCEIKSFQCDHGGEFDNHRLRTLFAQNGIQFRFSCSQTSQQNGKSERMVRTINTLIRTLLFK